MWTIELRRRLGPSCRVHAVVVHPGEVLTDVVRTLPATMQRAYHMFMRLLCLSPAQGLPQSSALFFGRTHVPLLGACLCYCIFNVAWTGAALGGVGQSAEDSKVKLGLQKILK